MARALRAIVHGRVQGVGFRAATVDRAVELGLLGWAKNQNDGTVAVHAEGDNAAVDALEAWLQEGPAAANVERVELVAAKVEGHEQFAVRGVPAGRFVVEPEAEGEGFLLWLELEDGWRRWRLTKPPSMVPADKRFAMLQDAAGDEPAPAGYVDAGLYEQGGRVAWPEAVERGHAVFVLHGQSLLGGFALQRTRGDGPGSGWFLIKRRDEFAVSR
ncbi:MAG: acylphosphatase [Solirubrobacteraceae bacterium]|nr:acylphosphatase [Solirubrobacteraceae bacterium]